MIKELVSLFKPKATDIPVELIEQFAKEYFASQAAVHNGDIPFQNYDFSLHFLSINTGKRMSSAKVILTFIDTRKGIYIPLLLSIGEIPHPAQEMSRLFGKQPNRLLAREIGYMPIRFSNHYYFAGGYQKGNQLAEISDYETYQRFHTLLIKLCTDCGLSPSKMTDEMLVDLRNFVANNEKIEVREPLVRLMANEHSDPWVCGCIFEKLEN